MRARRSWSTWRTAIRRSSRSCIKTASDVFGRQAAASPLSGFRKPGKGLSLSRNAELHDLSMPSCTTCQCRVARLVDIELYDLLMPSCTTLSISGKKKAVCRAFAGMKACGIRPYCLYGGNRRSIVEFDTVEEGDSLVDFFVHDDVFLDEGHFLAVFGDKTFDDGRAFQRTAEFQSLCGVH